jgi:hypothetical protein
MKREGLVTTEKNFEKCESRALNRMRPKFRSSRTKMERCTTEGNTSFSGYFVCGFTYVIALSTICCACTLGNKCLCTSRTASVNYGFHKVAERFIEDVCLSVCFVTP